MSADSPAPQPRRDQHGPRPCSTSGAAPTILDFYGDVFGWTEGDNTGEEGNPLILYTGAFGQFVYLLPGRPAATAPALDHFSGSAWGCTAASRRCVTVTTTGRLRTEPLG